jgi:hypothetical protein
MAAADRRFFCLSGTLTRLGCSAANAHGANAALYDWHSRYAILKVDLAAVGAGVGEQVALGVVKVMLAAAVGVDVTDDVLGVVAEQPFLAPVRMHDAVVIAGDVVVIAGLVAKRVGDVGQPDVLVPFKPGVVAAIVGPIADRFGMGAAVDAVS